MGHRKHSQPRRGSLAYLPRGRAKSMEARIRTWPNVEGDEPKLLGHAGFKAGCVQLVSIDDRDKIDIMDFQDSRNNTKLNILIIIEVVV